MGVKIIYLAEKFYRCPRLVGRLFRLHSNHQDYFSYAVIRAIIRTRELFSRCIGQSHECISRQEVNVKRGGRSQDKVTFLK